MITVTKVVNMIFLTDFITKDHLEVRIGMKDHTKIYCNSSGGI